MNKERIEGLIAALEQETLNTQLYPDPVGFDMEYFAPPNSCNTVCCLAGWTCILFNPDSWKQNLKERSPVFILTQAIELLELSYKQAMPLFFTLEAYSGKITTQKAITVLRHLLITGDVDWSVV